MPVYEYKCEEGHRFDRELARDLSEAYVGRPCFQGEFADDGRIQMCKKPLKRVYSSVQFASVMQEHFNPSVGKPISSMSQYRDELKRASERATEKTGILHNFQPADPNEGMED